MVIDQSALCYISMDPSRHALQTNGKLFFKFRNRFSNQLQFFIINSGWRWAHACEEGEAFVLISARSSYLD